MVDAAGIGIVIGPQSGGRWNDVELAVRRASGLLQTARGSLVAGVVASFGSLTPVAVSYTLIDVSGGKESVEFHQVRHSGAERGARNP